MTALSLAFLIFCVGVWTGYARHRRVSDIEAARLAAELMDAFRRAAEPVEIFVENRPYYSDCLEGPTYHVANVDALIALGSRATTGGV